MAKRAPQTDVSSLIAISYSKDEEQWKDRLISLFPTDENIEFVLDQVEEGPINQQLRTAISQSKVLVILLTPSYVVNSSVPGPSNPIPNIKNVHIVSVLIRPCEWQNITSIKKEPVTSGGKALADVSDEESLAALKSVVSEVLVFTKVRKTPSKDESSDLPIGELAKFDLSEEVQKVVQEARSLARLTWGDPFLVTTADLFFAFAEIGRRERTIVKTPQFLWDELSRVETTHYSTAFNTVYPRAIREPEKRKPPTDPGKLTSSALRLFQLAQTYSIRSIKLNQPREDVAPPRSDGRIAARHLLAAMLRVWHEEPWPSQMSNLLQLINVQDIRERFFDFVSEEVPADNHDEWRSILTVQTKTTKTTKARARKRATKLPDVAASGEQVESPFADVIPPLQELSAEDSIADQDERETEEQINLRPILAGFATDYWEGKDLLDTTQDVNALASLVAAWSVEPPLSIGLFGDWGSGKSHFMRQMRKRVEKLSRTARKATDKRQKDIGYYKNIVQIEFNAWHYIEGNLWASLVDHIFANLKVKENEAPGLVEARRDQLIEDLGVKKEIEAKLKTKLEQEKSELESKHKEAADLAKKAQLELESRSRQLAGFVSEAEAELDKLQVPFSFNDRDQALLKSLDIDSSRLITVADYRKRYDELKGIRNRIAAQWKLFWTDPKERKLTLLAAALTLIPLLGAMILKLPQMISIPGWFATLLAVVASIITTAAPTWNHIRKSREALKAKEAEANRELEQKKIKLNSEVIKLTEKVERSQAEAESIGKDISELQNKIDNISPTRILAEFIEDRAAANDYRRHLGLLALIRRDFEKLRELFEQQRDKEKEGTETDDDNRINRIVLYIDDLDRCPPQRVVEVLQAIHLLLAFPIFVVVVGVDARWVTRSLQESYEWLRLDDGDRKNEEQNTDNERDVRVVQGATPHDYLEKIFQIPFWLRPMKEAQTKIFIEGLTEKLRYRSPQEKEDGGQQQSNGNKSDEPVIPPVTPEHVVSNEVVSAGNGQPAKVAEVPANVTERQEEKGASLPERPVKQDDVRVAESSVPGLPPVDPPAEAQKQTEKTAEIVKSQQSEVDDEDEHDEQIDLTPDSLTLGDAEIEYMKSLADVISRSPRSVKRFLNCYRLIKVSLTPKELANFVQEGASSEFKSVMVLLGIITGAPTAALFVTEEIENWTWMNKRAPTMADLLSRLEKNEELLRQPDWDSLKTFLTKVGASGGSTKLFDACKRNAPRVSRFSFRISRAEAAGPKRTSNRPQAQPSRAAPR